MRHPIAKVVVSQAHLWLNSVLETQQKPKEPINPAPTEQDTAKPMLDAVTASLKIKIERQPAIATTAGARSQNRPLASFLL